MKWLIRQCFRKIWYFGFSKYCPVCNSWLRHFDVYGLKKRRDALCPVCKTVERHRFVWEFMKTKTTLLDALPKKFLHFAPESAFVPKFQNISSIDYVNADLYNPKAMLKMDITRIECADESVDVFYCSHVLEHIEDDVQAISEIYRVLKKEGYAIIMVPIMAQKTYEDFSITDPAEREKVFGQHDHVRLYGVDFKDKLMAPGFKVSAYYFDEMFCQKEMNRLGLKYVEAAEMPIYLCEKR